MCICAFGLLQLLAMPGEVIVAICMHLNPRSIFNFAKAHQYFNGYIDDTLIWLCISMESNWSFTNKAMLAMTPFAQKVQHMVLKCTNSVPLHLQSLPQGFMCKMLNLRTLSVQSPAFTQGYFVQRIPKLRSLLLLDCPNFDIDTLIEALQRVKRHKCLTVLDLSGVPRVMSLNKWQICSLCPNLQEAVSNAVMGDFIAKQCFLDCGNLRKFDCWPLLSIRTKWVQLRMRYAHLAFGNRICSSLEGH